MFNRKIKLAYTCYFLLVFLSYSSQPIFDRTLQKTKPRSMKQFLIILFLPLLILSCGGDYNKEDYLPDASGEHGNVLILMENNLWEGPLGQAIQTQLDQNIRGPFIRSEPMFSFYQMKPGTLNHLNKTSRLILKVYVDHDSTYAETALIEKYNVYAKGQLFIVIKDSDVNRLMTFINQSFDHVIDVMNDFELEQLMATYKKRKHSSIQEKCEQKFGMSIYVPEECKLKVERDSFMWVKYDRSHDLIANQSTGAEGGTFWIQEGLVFWSEPYSDSAMDPYHILEKRDTILKYNIPGKVKGSWMATEYDPCCAPEGLITKLNGQDCVIFQGNWKHDGNPGAVGGGPFVQYSVHNPERDIVLTVCGYVYAPKFDKREYIRELHAMLSSLTLAGQG